MYSFLSGFTRSASGSVDVEFLFGCRCRCVVAHFNITRIHYNGMYGLFSVVSVVERRVNRNNCTSEEPSKIMRHGLLVQQRLREGEHVPNQR